MFHFTDDSRHLGRHVQTICLGCYMSIFILLVLKFCLSIVGRGSLVRTPSKRTVNILKMKLQRMKGKLAGERV